MKKISIFFFIFFCLKTHAQKPELKVLNKSGCAALTVIVADTTFYVGKTPILWTWVWGDGNQISLTKDTSSHTYYTSGNYSIFMRVCFSNGTCDSVIISGIQVYAKPNVNFAILPKQGCHPQSVCFTNNTVYNCGAKLSYNIDYGDGIIDDSNKTQFFGNTFCHTYLNPGNFHVKIVMKNTCGCYSDTIYLNGVIVKQTPKVNFTAIDTVGCNDNAFPSFINKTIGPANTNYFWSFGDGATSTQTNPSHLYNGPPLNYTIKLVAINPDGNCKDSMVKIAFIKINDINVDFSMNKTGVCVLNPDTISFFNNTVGFLSCLWDFGDNTFSSAINPKKRYFVAGNMVVKLSVNYIVNGIACVKSITKTIFVDNKPKAKFIPSDSFFCGANGFIAFANQSIGATSYNWEFDNAIPSSSSNLFNPGTINFIKAGQVRLYVISQYGCRDTFVREITRSGVIKNMIVNNAEGCVPLSVNFTNNSTPIKFNDSIISFKWDLDGDGVFEINGPIGNKTYLAPCSSIVKYEVRTKLGCITKDSLIIKHGIKKKPSMDIIGTVGCRNDTLIVKYTGPLPIHSLVLWPFDTIVNTMGNTKIPLKPPLGPSPINLTLVSKYCGCTETAFYFYNMNVKGPFSSFTYTVNCNKPNKRKVLFNNTSVGSDSSWWYLNGKLISTSKTNFQYTLGYSGCHIVKLVGYNVNSGCRDTFYSDVCVFDSFEHTYNPTPICINQYKYFEVGDQGISSCRWILSTTNFIFDTTVFGISDPFRNQKLAINKEFSNKGIYDVTSILTDYNLCKDTLIFKNGLIVNKVVGRLVVDSPICINNDALLKLEIDSSYLPITTNIFNPNGVPINVGSKNFYFVNYTIPGNKTIVGIARDSVGCQMVKLKGIAVLDNNSKFTKSRDSICPGQSIVFSALNLDTNVTFDWSFQDASVTFYKQRVTIPIIFNSLGSKVVQLIVKSKVTGCSDTSFDIVNVIQLFANFSTDKAEAFCNATVVNFKDSSVGNINKYYWDFGDGSGLKQLAKNVFNLYLYPNEYLIKLVVENPAGCRDSIIKNAFNLRGPIANYSIVQEDSCEFAPMKVVVTSKYATKVEVVTGIGPPKIFNYISGVCGVINLGCKDSMNYTIYVSGNYSVQFNVSDGICNYFKVSIPQNVNIYNKAIPNFAFPVSAICANEPLALIDSTVFKNFYFKKYFWRYGINSDTSSETIPIIKFSNTAGFQKVKLYVATSPTCIDSIEKSIMIFPLPESNFKVRDTCVNMPVIIDSLIIKGDIKKFKWDFGDGIMDSINLIVKHIYSQSKIYQISLELIDTNNCKSKLIKNVFVGRVPELGIALDTIKCIQDTLLLKFRGVDFYTWTDLSELVKINDSTINFYNKQDKDFAVLLKNYGCLEINAKMKIRVHPENKIEAWADPGLIELGNSSILKVKIDKPYQSILWTPSEFLNCTTCDAPTTTPNVSQIYKATIVYKVGENTCTNSDTALILLDGRNIEDIIDFTNIFSPNGDGKNDRFRVNVKDVSAEILNFELRIYNRWGEKMFETNDWKMTWDGFFLGQPQPVGAYICFVFYTLKGRKTASRSYPISLIR